MYITNQKDTKRTILKEPKKKYKKHLTKVGWLLDDSWQNLRLQIFISFHNFFVPFCGFKPHPRRKYFIKSNIKWAFFIYSNTFKSHLIHKLQRRGQPQNSKNEGNQNRDLFL